MAFVSHLDAPVEHKMPEVSLKANTYGKYSVHCVITWCAWRGMEVCIN